MKIPLYTLNTLVVLGNDKIGRRAHFEIRTEILNQERLAFALDNSSGAKRIIGLLANKRINAPCLLQMLIAEIRRRNYPPRGYDFTIKSNNDLCRILENFSFDCVVLFRAGLIISKHTLSTGVVFMNIHCAKIPEYGGLCSIYRALKDGACDQKCCLHVITTKIDDSSKVLDTEPYTLHRRKSYFWNEEKAYHAGIQLLKRTLSDPVTSEIKR